MERDLRHDVSGAVGMKILPFVIGVVTVVVGLFVGRFLGLI